MTWAIIIWFKSFDQLLTILLILPQSSLSRVHKLTRMSKLSKNETCSLCMKTMSAFFTQGFKCTACHLVFHVKCIQQGTNSAQVSIISFSVCRSLSSAQRIGSYWLISVKCFVKVLINTSATLICFRLYHRQYWNAWIRNRVRRWISPSRGIDLKRAKPAGRRWTVQRPVKARRNGIWRVRQSSPTRSKTLSMAFHSCSGSMSLLHAKSTGWAIRVAMRVQTASSCLLCANSKVTYWL